MRVLSGGVVLAYTRVSNGANDDHRLRLAEIGEGDVIGNGYRGSIK